MNIVMISGNPIGEFYGGVKVHVEYLSSFLSHFGDLKLNILTYGNKNTKYEKNGVNFIVLKRLKFGKILFPIQIFYDLFRLEREVKKLNPDIIHIQSTIPTFSLFGTYITRRYLTLITLHGYFKEEYKIHTGIEKIFNRVISVPLEKLALSKIPNIIVVCPQIMNMIKNYTRSKIFIVPNGVSLKYIEKIKPIKEYNDPTIFYVGLLNRRKGVHDLIQSMPLVKNKVQNVKLYIGGTGPYINKLKQLVTALDLEKDVIFLGFITDEEKFAYMKAIDIFVLPSYWESFPIVLLEAMASGKPIITTDIAGNPFAVTDRVNGYLVKPGDWQQLAEKLIYMFNNKTLISKMGEESKKRSLDFDWIAIAQQTREIYLKIDGDVKVEIDNKNLKNVT